MKLDTKEIGKIAMKLLDTINKLPPTHRTTVLITVICGTLSLMHPWSELLLRMANG